MKVTAPLFSLDASGSIGGAIVASKWKGRNYMRRLVTPANPQSDGQTTNRGIMGFLARAWAGIAALDQAAWNDLAAQGNFSPFNAYVRYNMRLWTQWTYPIQSIPDDGSGTAGTIATVTAAGGVGQISGTVALTGDQVDNWGLAFYVNGTNDTVIAKTDLKLAIEKRDTSGQPYAITNLDPGVYYVKCVVWTIGGVYSVTVISGAATVL